MPISNPIALKTNALGLFDSIGKGIVKVGTKLVAKNPSPMIMGGGGSSSNEIQMVGTPMKWFSMQGATNIYEALTKCPQVSSVLYQKSLAASNGRLVIETMGRDGEYELSKDLNKFGALLAQPNIYQNDVQFRIQVMMMIQAYGYCPVLKLRSEGFNDVRSLWALPPNCVELVPSKDTLISTNYNDVWDKMYFVGGGSSKVELPKEDVYIFTDITPYYTDLRLPESRLASLKYPISNIIHNYRARGVLLKNRGATGILSNKQEYNGSHIKLMPGEKEQLHEDFKKYNILNDDDWNVIITNAALEWQPMSLPMKDMMLTEQMTICEALNFPFNLMAHGSETTFNNSSEAAKHLYQNIIIPESMNYSQQLEDLLDAKKAQVRFRYDYSDVSALQDDKRKDAQAYKMKVEAIMSQWQMNVITFNQVQELLGNDMVSGGDYYYNSLTQNNTNG
jgi:phage portal protein BeeE